MIKNMQKLIAEFESAGELHRVKAPVDPELEITEITDRMSKSQGLAILFENVRDFSFPVITNAFGSYSRMRKILGCHSFDDIGANIQAYLNQKPPGNLKEKLRTLFTLKELSGFLPRKVKSAPCKEVVHGPESELLDLLPILTCWPQDADPFITLPLVVTRDPDTGTQNLGMYRMQKFDRATTGMHWQYNKDGARHFEKYREKKQRMEVAVALGGSPAVTYASTAPMPPEVDELLLAGFLNNSPVEIAAAKTVDLFVPAQSDFIIEGYIDPEEYQIEGPFGDHTGFYSPADYYPVFHVICITRRSDAVYPATVVGKPPMEDVYMAKATERIFLPLIRMLVPEIVDMELPMEGVFHNCALVTIDKRHPAQAKKVINALWGLGQMASTKFIAVFDSDIDLRDSSTVVWKLLNNVDPKRDMIFSEGPLDALDHSAPYPNFGGKMGVDVTRKSREEGMGRPWPEEISMSKDIVEKVSRRWKDYGF